MLIDSATIHVRSGKGGDGVVAFRREKYIPKGGPSGGDGGNGGSVYLLAHPETNTLLDFAGRHHWAAENGQPGAAKQCHGAAGEDLVIRVPVGTLVHNDETGELLADMDRAGKRVLIAQGGRGGFGNEHFKSATNQTPTEATAGEPAQALTLRLELKLMADVGLVGKPNAGKSTLLSRVSRATPRIADYPFTTLEPQLGIADLDAVATAATTSGGGRRLVVADIPGLIENAHRGTGLGTRFLRHIERTQILVHVLEIEPTDGSDPITNYRVIRNELARYSPELAAKHEVIALSKMDLLGTDEDRATAAALIRDELGRDVYPISAATGAGLPELLDACWRLLDPRHEPTGWRQADADDDGAEPR
jgi:GTP-binding protein